MTPYLEEEDYPTSEVAFSNEQVDLNTIPSLAFLEYSPLQPALLKADVIWTVLFFAIGYIITLVLRFVFGVEFMILYGLGTWAALTVLLLLTLVFIYFSFHKKNYAIRQRDIIYNSGLFWQSSIVIPFNRVQHCEVSQGPIDRFFDLAELKIFTAGGSSSDLSIGGLLPDNAQRIKDFIVQKTASDEEE